MKWSFSIGHVAGIDIRVHATFFFVLGLAATQWGAQHGPRGAAFGVLLMLLLFLCVVLHELGHSLVAQRFGLGVKEIVLLPIGGVARLTKNPETPRHELLIAAAGPLVNAGLALVLLLVLGVAAPMPLDGRGLLQGRPLDPSIPSLLLWLLAANVTLAVFNLIPAFPMDGGRILRAALAMFVGFSRATQLAAALGQFLAMALGLFAVATGHFLLALVALFVFAGAGGERAAEQARTVLTTLRVGDAYNKYAITLAPGDHVSTVVDYILTSYQPDFAVQQGRELLGVVTRGDVLRALSSDTRDLYVAGVMVREVLKVDKNATLEEVRETLAEKAVRVAAVYDGEAFLGLVSQEDIAEALLVTTFVRRQEEARRAEQGG